MEPLFTPEASRRVPDPGDVVRVRTRLHLVEDVARGRELGEGSVVRLRCIDDDALQSLDVVVWEAEPDATCRQLSPSRCTLSLKTVT